MLPLPQRCVAAVVAIACVTLSFVPSTLAQSREIIIPAEKLAPPDQPAPEPTAGKWWLNREARAWDANTGTILMTGRPSEEPVVKTGLWQVTPISRFVPY